MARRTKEIFRSSRDRSPFERRRARDKKEGRLVSTFEQINAIARRDARLEIGEKKNRLFLTNWWCRQYNRPLKDPLLKQYTTEELAYEFYLINEIDTFTAEKINEVNDRIEEELYQKDIDWADEMEADELAEEARIKVKKAKKAKEAKEAEEAKIKEKEKTYDPLKDPEQLKWMEEEIEKNKSVFGEDFGEDVSLDFEGDD